MHVDPARPQLRPRTVGQLLDATFRQYRQHIGFILLASLLILLPDMILNIIFGVQYQLDKAVTVPDGGAGQGQVAVVQPGFFIWLGVLVISSLVFAPLLYGTILRYLTHETLAGERVSGMQAFMHALRRLASAFVTNLLRYLLVLVAYMVCVGIAALAITALFVTHVPLAISVPLAVIVGLAALLGVTWLFVNWAFTSSVVMEEKRTLWPAMARSWSLVKGNFWRVLGYLLLASLIAGGITLGFSIAANLLHSGILSGLITSLVTVCLAPFRALATANMYLDLRARTDVQDLKDWLDSGSIVE